MAKFCRQCGASMRDEATFCGQCGENLRVPPIAPESKVGGTHPARWLRLALIGVFVIIVVLAGSLITGNFKTAWSKHAVDSDGDGVVSGDEAWAELHSMPDFRAGTWLIKSGDFEDHIVVLEHDKYSQSKLKIAILGNYFNVHGGKIEAPESEIISNFNIDDGKIGLNLCSKSSPIKTCVIVNGTYSDTEFFVKFEYLGSQDGHRTVLLEPLSGNLVTLTK